MRNLDLITIHAPKFPKYANMGEGNVAAEDGEFSIGIEFGSTESTISAIKSYIISKEVDYIVYESEPQTFYAKCKGYSIGCDWLIRTSLIRKKDASKPLVEANPSIKVKYIITAVQSRFNYTLHFDMIADASKPLVEANPSIKVKYIIVAVQSRFNYTVSYHKTWLTKQKSVAKVSNDWEVLIKFCQCG
ncbi:hypothetical protein Ahy_A09g045408 [Arachis hypogaea]|uniref:Transposase MuDR plant domain-containing protein n=1 Tax=Arachis hypogaea TaxID=3818 RepID=A0A445BMA4_ARAHY|nr:hypothetical protein Ahy_A09g045408 [Arachis hypogaea]